MASFRQLAPALPSGSVTQPVLPSQPSEVTNVQKSKKRKRHVHSKQKWESMRPAIVQTYENHTMEKTMEIVKERCGFEASLRQYKKMLAEWGTEKHYPSDVLQFVLQKSRERSHQGKATVVLLNGAQVDSGVIEKFRARQQYASQAAKNSPPKVTPKGLEYFTPQSPVVAGERFYATPHVFTPISKLSALAVRSLESLESDPTALALLRYDIDPQKVRIIRAKNDGGSEARIERESRRELALSGHLDYELDRVQRRARQKWLSQVEYSTPKHTHHRGDLAIIGSGRFERDASLTDILWSSQDFARKVYRFVHELKVAESTVLTMNEDFASMEAEKPEYHFYIDSDTNIALAVESLIALLRHNKLIQKILGMSKQDASCWIGPWRPMTSEKASLLQDVALHLFGNTAGCYPNMQNFTMLVHFASDGLCPLLLKLSFAIPLRDTVEDCLSCDSLPMVVDYISQAGALKMHTSASAAHFGTPWHRLEDLTRRCSLQSTVFFSKWSQTAHIAQGLYSARHARRCYCNGAIHKERFGPHYIDMEKELDMKNERWCPKPDDRPGEDFFNAFPGGEESLIYLVVENGDDQEDRSDEEVWDPLGVTGYHGNDDSFDPYPSEDEAEDRYISKPMYFRNR